MVKINSTVPKIKAIYQGGRAVVPAKITLLFWITQKAVIMTASFSLVNKFYSPNQRAISRSTDSGESEP